MKNKKILIPIMVLAGALALYEQSKDNTNIWIMIVAIIVFMFGMMRLSAATPSKKDQDNTNDYV